MNTAAPDLAMLEALQKVFLEETSEMLERLERNFLQLEENPCDRGIMEDIFRIVHTIKGSANSVNFLELGTFAHILENLLVSLKRGEIENDSTVITLLLACRDRLCQFVEVLNINPQMSVQTGDLETRLNKILVLKNKSVTQDSESRDTGWGLFDDEISSDSQTHNVNSRFKPKQTLTQSDGDCTKIVKTEESVRLPLQKIDTLINLFGEQVILQGALEQARHDIVKNRDQIEKTILHLGKITYDLQHTAMSLRMISVSGLFNKMKRTVRDTAKSLGKNVSLVVHGEDTELDKTFVDELSGAVTHVLRNAVDHGLETAEERIRFGKTPAGTVSIDASQESGYFYLRIKDDGRGLCRERILKKAIENGLVGETQVITDEEIYNLIFENGFSTAEKLTDVSGRGIGMDAVKTVVESLRGSVSVESQANIGTTITIKLPLTMAIFNGMVFTLNGERYIIPSKEVREIIRFKPEELRSVDDHTALVLMGNQTIPIVRLKRFATKPSNPVKWRPDQRVVAFVIARNNREYAFTVDEVIGQQRIVFKKLGAEMENLPGVSGGAILGDGKIAMILDINALE